MIEQPRWLNDDEQELWQLILAATRKLDRGMENTLQAGGELSMPEFAVLATLSDAEEQQMRLRELCNFLEWDRSRTSHQVTRMERRGLLTKCKSVGDARGVMVKLTEDRKSTRLNSSHVAISYAVFCLKKKKRRRIHARSTA